MNAVARAFRALALFGLFLFSVSGNNAFAQLKVTNGMTSPAASAVGVNAGGLKNAPLTGVAPAPTWPAQSFSNVPYELQLLTSQGVIPTQYASQTTSSGQVLMTVLNPSVNIIFPLAANETGCIYPYMTCKNVSVGWKGVLYADACMTSAEAAAYTGALQQTTATLANPDSTCPPEPNAANTAYTVRNWYQIGQAQADLYVVQNSTAVPSVTVSLPLNLQGIATTLRFRTAGNEYDYRAAHTGPNSLTDMQQDDCPNSAIQCYPLVTNYISPPLAVVVAPAALVQLKVLPQTILYVPPGDESNAAYEVESGFSTTVFASATTEVDNSNTQDNWLEEIDSGGITESIEKVLSLGYTSGTDTRWDTKTTLTAGQSQETDLTTTQGSSWWVNNTVGPMAGTVPGQNGTYANAPFWGDTIYVLVHPQYAVWNFYGTTKVQLIAALSTGPLQNSTTYFHVSDLDVCAKGTSGYSFPLAQGGTETLTPAECTALAQLDPFYGKGQSADLTQRGQLIWGPNQYGIDPTNGGDTAPSIGNAATTSATTTTINTANYSSTVEDIVATTQSQGLTMGADSSSLSSYVSLSLKYDVTLKQGSSIDDSTSMNVTYKNSNATTNTSLIQHTGTLNDNTNRGYPLYAEIYQDSIFGTMMFRDPSAPCATALACSQGVSGQTLLAKQAPKVPVVAKPAASAAPAPAVLTKTNNKSP